MATNAINRAPAASYVVTFSDRVRPSDKKHIEGMLNLVAHFSGKTPDAATLTPIVAEMNAQSLAEAVAKFEAVVRYLRHEAQTRARMALKTIDRLTADSQPKGPPNE
jgi:hypothetical protein